MKGIITERMHGPEGKVEALKIFIFREAVTKETMEFSHYNGGECANCGGGAYMVAGPLATQAMRQFGGSVLKGYGAICLRCNIVGYCALDAAILVGYFFEWAC